jgi:uncharacterized SAM-binding protein YcdF (DUF218 family)
MTLPVLLLILLIAAGLFFRGWRRSAWSVFGVAAVLGLAIGCGPVAAGLLAGLQQGYPGDIVGAWGPHAAIVLLGGGDERVSESRTIETSPLAYGRVMKALELYQACKGQGGDCYILASGGDPQRYGTSEAAVYGAHLRAAGVPAADIVLEQKSLNTWQNAWFSAPLIQQRPATRVALVTSGIHVRRAQLYFRHFGVQASPVRADHVSAVMSPVPLSWNFLLADLALHEYEGILRYHLYQALGWNVTARGAGAL